MGILTKFVILWLTPLVLESLKIITENVTVEYVNGNYLEVNPGVYKINQTNAVNLIFKLKIDLPESTKVYAKGFKWVNNAYRLLPIIQVEKRVKNILEMDMFDLQSLWIHHARPPVVWPIQKNVTYRIEGWIPDTSKFPPNVPLGRWKFQLAELFANKTKVVVLNWFGKFQ